MRPQNGNSTERFGANWTRTRTCWRGRAARSCGRRTGQRSSWAAPTAAQVRGELERWLAARQTDGAARQRFESLWPAGGELPPGVDLLEQTAITIGLFDEEKQPLVALCRGTAAPRELVEFAWLSDEQTPEFVRNNLRLLYGRWLAQHRLYDEALAMLGDLSPADVCDPATLLFYRGVAHHRLLQKDECLAAVQQLLEGEASIPRRYAVVARLMEADLRPLRVDSLDEVSRLMEDVRRRLGLGRAGRRVRQEEDDVIAKLDKMIEEVEKQQQQQQMAAANPDGSKSSRPAEDSLPLGGRGPGDVDQKPTGNTAGWGNLPPKQREEALQQMGKDLPAHYRELIEEYFRKLARDGSE